MRQAIYSLSHFRSCVLKAAAGPACKKGRRQSVDFINVLSAAFTLADPKSAKKLLDLTVFFALLGYASVKSACRILMKLAPGNVTISIFFFPTEQYETNRVNYIRLAATSSTFNFLTNAFSMSNRNILN